MVKLGQQHSAETEKPTEPRGQWGNKMEFFLATLGYSVGIGEITRFPYLCMKNGGGAFLIPFLVALFAGGVPLFYLEVVLGQFSGLSPLTVWTFCPIFRGVGYSCVLLSGIVGTYYNMLLGWCIFYLVKSLAGDVPWRGCNNTWNTEKCYDPSAKTKCIAFDVDENAANSSTIFPGKNCTEQDQPPKSFLLPSEDFWNNVILGTNNSGIEDIGSLRWQLALALFTAWFIVFLCLSRGVRSSGKVVYVTATAPYLLLTALLIRGVTLEGAADGLIYFLKPNFTTLADHNVWIEASLQMFFSLGPAWGGLITMASYNKFNHRLYVEAIAIPFADIFTAMYGGFAIFSVIGFMAKQAKMPIEHFAASGAGLAFVVYPQAIAEMPISPFWSILFFLTLLTLGIDSQFGFVDTVVSGLFDLVPKLRHHRIKVTASVIGISFLAGLPLCTEGGMYVYVLLDWYAATVTCTVVAFLEIIVVAYIYGVNRFSSDIELMLGSRPNLFWRLSWFIATPLFMTALLCVGVWNLQAPSYQSYVYPSWAIAIGWMIALVSFVPIPVFMVVAFVTDPHKTFSAKFANIFLPNDDWIPAKKELVDDYRRKHAKDRKLCVFCREQAKTGQLQPASCDSLFKCWVCFCTARLFGSRRRGSNNSSASGKSDNNILDVTNSPETITAINNNNRRAFTDASSSNLTESEPLSATLLLAERDAEGGLQRNRHRSIDATAITNITVQEISEDNTSL